MMEILKRAVSPLNMRLAIMDTAHLPDIKEEFDRCGIDTSPYYNFNPEDGLTFTPKSVIVAASPSTLSLASFVVDGVTRLTVIPPTYTDGRMRFREIEVLLAEPLKKQGYSLARVSSLPCKPIAVRTGLGTYGRNNLVYVDGMGSFMNLHLYLSDMPPEGPPLQPPKLMDNCADCRRCNKNCPTSALSPDRELVDADRCLTHLNEGPGPFPDWVEPAWHNALMGCVRCQIVCPANRPYITTVRTAAAYNADETRNILNNTASPESLTALGYAGNVKVLARNLTAVLSRNL